LFHCDQGADPDVGQALDRLDDDFDILALFVGGRESGRLPNSASIRRSSG